MTEKKITGSRRKALKSIAAGTGAVVAGKSMPESWSKPVIDSAILPAHAQTSQHIICTPSPDSIIVTNDASLGCEEDNPDVAIVFDCIRCQLVGGCFPGASAATDQPDALVIIDIDTNEAGWEWEDTGENWQVTGNNFPAGQDVDGMADGTYTLSATRAPTASGNCSVELTFRITTSNTDVPNAATTLTVDDVAIKIV